MVIEEGDLRSYTLRDSSNERICRAGYDHIRGRRVHYLLCTLDLMGPGGGIELAAWDIEAVLVSCCCCHGEFVEMGVLWTPVVPGEIDETVDGVGGAVVWWDLVNDAVCFLLWQHVEA
jgi:hypothetical protein